jgi:hypothetical protein
MATVTEFASQVYPVMYFWIAKEIDASLPAPRKSATVATPVSTYENTTYSTVQITSDPRMPIGMSRAGFLVSCAAVDTASKPMKAKNTTPAAPRTPITPPNGWVTPSGVVYVVAAGMNGTWLAGFMNPQPMPITISTIATFVMTMTPLTNADSAVPRMRIADRQNRMNTAGILMMPCVVVPAIVSSGE